LAAKVGSDVPYFLHGGNALVEGRGEIVTPLPDTEPSWYVLAYVPVTIPHKTTEVYSRVQPRLYTLGDRSKLLAAEIASGKGVLSHHFYNVFEGIAFLVFPGLREFYTEFIRVGAENIRLTGAGPTLFDAVPNEAAGMDLLQKCDRRGLPAYLVKSIARQL
jgi:4-diphosphocytidyl-2-C-methyl-D-erythritol kinase